MSNREIRQAIVTFIECEIVGEWNEFDITAGSIKDTRKMYKCWREGASIRLVRPDEMIREFSFRNGSEIFVGESSVRFSQDAVIDEHSVDQDVRDGTRKNVTVVKP